MSKTGQGLAEYAKAQLGRPYWWGTFGQRATPELLRQKRQQYPSYYQSSDYDQQMGLRVHDCCGLIKGYLWSDGPDGTPRYNGAQDFSVQGFFSRCRTRGGMKDMPEIVGCLVFEAGLGHVGVYVGNGQVVEAMGHAYGVVQTRLKERSWAYWGLPDMIEYAPGDVEAQEPAVNQFCHIDAPLLCRGSSGGWVKGLQTLLIAHGYACGGKVVNGHEIPDGDFGPSTEKAVRDFQALYRLEIDGEAGEKTWTALLSR